MNKPSIFVLLTALVASGIYFRSVQSNEKVFTVPEIIDAIHAHGVNDVFKDADIYKYRQDYPKALSAFEKLLSRDLKPNEKKYALNQAAYISLRMNDDSSAARYNQLSSEEKLPITGNIDEADYDYNVGVWAYRTFKPKMAELYLRRALEFYKKNYGDRHLKTAMCLSALGIYYYEYGDSQDSIVANVTRANTVFRNNPALKNWSPECLLGMAIVSGIKRRNDELVGYTEQAINILNAQPYKDSILLARCWSYKGRGLNFRRIKMSKPEDKQRIHREIEDCFKNAIAICPKNVFRLQEFYRDRTRYYAITDSLSDPDFKTHFWSSLADAEQLVHRQGQDRFILPERLKGLFYSRINQPDSIIKYFTNFFAWYKADTLKMRDVVSVAPVFLANEYEDLYDLRKEPRYLDSALVYRRYILFDEVGEKNTDKSWKGIIASDLTTNQTTRFIRLGAAAFVLFKKYEATHELQSLDTCFQIINITDKLVFKSLTSQDDDAFDIFQTDISSIYATAIKSAIAYYDLTHDKKYLDAVFKFGERVRSFLLFRDAVSKTENSLHVPSLLLLDSMRQLESQIDALKLATESGKTDNIELLEKNNRREAFAEQLHKKYPEYYQTRVEQPIPTITEVQNDLRPLQVLVQFTFSENKLHTLFIGKKSIFLTSTDWDTVWDNKIRKIYTSMSGTEANVTAQQFSTAGSDLYNKLFPKLPAVFQYCNELLISPDRILNMLPFETLTESTGSTKDMNFKTLPYLVHRYEIIYAPSWKMYAANKNSTLPKQPSLRAYTYDFESNELPAAKKEFDALQNIFGKDISAVIGKNCTKQFFLTDTVVKCDILHLSLHAESNANSKYDNKIYFAHRHKDTVYGFNLLQRQFSEKLIVLSACNTAFGKIAKGEGAFTLSRNFLRAGVPCVVASFWSIPDLSTEKITTAFYRNLQSKDTPARALQNAKKQYLADKNTNSNSAHPRFWAGLVCLQ